MHLPCVVTGLRGAWGATLLLLVFVAAGCRCQPPVVTVSAELAAEPAALDFGDVPSGQAVTRTVTLTNAGRVPVTVALVATPPYTAPAQVHLGGGDQAAVPVTFDATTQGAVPGELHADTDTQHLRIAMTATVVAPCAATTCHAAGFDADAGRCTLTELPEDTACQGGCLVEGRCHAGGCFGATTMCDDHDACTLDACAEDGGCLHLARTCPVTDPCAVPTCDPAGGCGAVPADDGIVCGDVSCSTARICLGGACVSRARPGAQDECRFRQLSANGRRACGVTFADTVRCWGDNFADQLARGFINRITAPGDMVGLVGPRAVQITGEATLVATQAGRVEVRGYSPTGLATASYALDTPPGSLIGPGVVGEKAGVVWMATPDGGTQVVATDVVALAAGGNQVCMARDGGEILTGLPGVLWPRATLPGLTSVGTDGWTRGCALVSGQVWCWGDAFGDFDTQSGPTRLLFDGGVRLLEVPPAQGGGRSLCVVRGDRVTCLSDTPAASGVGTVPPSEWEVPGLTSLSCDSSVCCALAGAGEAWCWGFNFYGLMNHSEAPVGVVELPWRVSALTTGANRRLAFTDLDGGSWAAGEQHWDDDAGRSWVGGREALPAPLQPGARLLRLNTGGFALCRLEAGDLRCEGALESSGPLNEIHVPATVAGVSDFAVGLTALCAGGDSGEVRCWSTVTYTPNSALPPFDAGAPVVAVAVADEQTSTRACGVRRDGLVRCDPLAPPLQRVAESLTDVASLCFATDNWGLSFGCALHRDGALQCWDDGHSSWVGSPAPVTPLGAPPSTRRLACSGNHVCAQFGPNGVKCWGGNLWNEVGREGPRSASAVTFALPESLRDLVASTEGTCAVGVSGRAWCWGRNFEGSFGEPVLTRSEQPMRVDP